MKYSEAIYPPNTVNKRSTMVPSLMKILYWGSEDTQTMNTKTFTTTNINMDNHTDINGLRDHICDSYLNNKWPITKMPWPLNQLVVEYTQKSIETRHKTRCPKKFYGTHFFLEMEYFPVIRLSDELSLIKNAIQTLSLDELFSQNLDFLNYLLNETTKTWLKWEFLLLIEFVSTMFKYFAIDLIILLIWFKMKRI